MFAEKPFNRDAWGKYRCEFSEMGDSQDEATVVEKLLGGPPKVDVLVKWLHK